MVNIWLRSWMFARVVWAACVVSMINDQEFNIVCEEQLVSDRQSFRQCSCSFHVFHLV